jgi:hypothetical protein
MPKSNNEDMRGRKMVPLTSQKGQGGIWSFFDSLSEMLRGMDTKMGRNIDSKMDKKK